MVSMKVFNCILVVICRHLVPYFKYLYNVMSPFLSSAVLYILTSYNIHDSIINNQRETIDKLWVWVMIHQSLNLTLINQSRTFCTYLYNQICRIVTLLPARMII